MTAARPVPQPIEPTPAASLRLDDLLGLPAADLAARYAAGRTPTLAEVSGDLDGRMLAVPALGAGALADLIRRWASNRSAFPWAGKSFTPGEARGVGENRLFGDRVRRYKFDTFIGKSRAGDFDALQLDYGRPDNPWFIRPIRDELRTIAPGLFLGQAWVEARGKPTLALYFGLEAPR
jgi:hypothetical protein